MGTEMHPKLEEEMQQGNHAAGILLDREIDPTIHSSGATAILKLDAPLGGGRGWQAASNATLPLSFTMDHAGADNLLPPCQWRSGSKP